MSKTLAVGTTVKIASTYGAAKAVSAISNANPAVATLEASHGVIVGDIVHLSSGWGLADNRLFRASVVDTNDVTLEGFNTLNTDLYPAGSGVGTAREITGWTEITQITREYQVSGGETNYADISDLKDRQDKKIPVSRSAVDVKLPIYDDPGLAFYAKINDADAIETGGAFIYPNNRKVYFAGFWSIGDIATVSDSTLRNVVDVGLASRPTSYAS